MEEGKEALRFKQLRLKKIRLPFDTGYLDIIIAFIYKESVLRTRKVLQNIAKLFDIIDDSIYADKPQVEDRIWIIRNSLNAIIKEGFESAENIKSYLFDQIECDESKTKIISNINQETYKISYEESKYLIKQIEDRLQFGYSITIKEEMQKLFDRIDVGDFKSYKSVMEDIYDLSVSILNGRRAISSLDSDQTFSLRDEYFEDVITESVNNLKDKDKMFVTGIKWWNVILAPAYLSKRLYTYLAFPGGGKSQILLKSALDIKKYNGHVKPKDPNHIPTILYITMENDIDETIERVFNMTCSSDDIRNYTPKQVAKKLRKEGQLAITNDNSIDILIKYYPNRSIDTNDLYTIIKDMEDNGSECIALILDYLKRIRPAEKGANEKEELKNITNELKTLAKTLDIPVITAQQLNRAAASVVDAAIQSKKEDLIKLIGRDGVSGAWEIIENSDWVCILYQETKQDTEQPYMAFKLIKRRYRSSEEDEKLRRLEYFYHPYDPENSIALLDDYDMPKSLSLHSLASELETPDNLKRGKKNSTKRPKEKDDGNPVDLELSGLVFDDFDRNVSTQF